MTKIPTAASAIVLTFTACLALVSCTKSPTDQAAQEQTSDPAQANLAPVSQPLPPAASQAPAPTQQAQVTYPNESAYQPPAATSDENYPDSSYDNDPNQQPLVAEQPPPPLPQYSQPECPGDNYIWTPGSWGYASAGYYWIPGAWVLAPYVGALWTPPYWGYSGTHYRWYHGYWASHIGFYGGINYGFGYFGHGYEGGYWDHNRFAYNRTVNNVNISVVHNVYNYRITNITNERISYNGGRGGINARPLPAEAAVLHERRLAPVPAQVAHIQQAAANRAQFESVNHGRPAQAVVARPLATDYRAPAPHPTAVPGAREMPVVGNTRRPEPARAGATRVEPTRAEAPAMNRPAVEPRPENRSAADRPTVEPRNQPRPEAVQPRSQPRAKERPAPEARPEQRSAPQPRAEPRAAEPQRRAEPRAEPHQAVQHAAPKAESRPEHEHDHE